MTKKKIAMRITNRTGIKRIITEKVIQNILDEIISILTTGETIELRNFGVFKVRPRKAKTARNPRTGETVLVPPRKTVIFKPGLIMKQKINN